MPSRSRPRLLACAALVAGVALTLAAPQAVGADRRPPPPSSAQSGPQQDGLTKAEAKKKAAHGRTPGRQPQPDVIWETKRLKGTEYAPTLDSGAIADAGEDTLTDPDPLPCTADGDSGDRIVVHYVRAEGAADRIADARPLIRGAMEVANGIVARSAVAQDSYRQLRVQTSDGSGCLVSIGRHVMPSAALDDFASFKAVVEDRGLRKGNRKQFYFLDRRNPTWCGMAERPSESDVTGPQNWNNAGGTIGVAWLGCWDGHTAAHEILHMLGAVASTAPNSSGFGHCHDERDLMCYDDDGAGVPTVRSGCGTALSEERADCGRNDYFSTAPPAGNWLATHWNTATSGWLFSGGASFTWAPSHPVAVTTTTRADGSSLITWEASPVDTYHEAATSYRVERWQLVDAATNTAGWVPIATVKAAPFSVVDPTPTRTNTGEIYHRVVALNAGGEAWVWDGSFS